MLHIIAAYRCRAAGIFLRQGTGTTPATTFDGKLRPSRAILLSTTADTASSGMHLVRVGAQGDREACEPDAPHRDGARFPLDWWLPEKTPRKGDRVVLPSTLRVLDTFTYSEARQDVLQYCRSITMCRST